MDNNKTEEKSIQEVLKLALSALEASKPTYAQYPEPVERHALAISEIKKKLA